MTKIKVKTYCMENRIINKVKRQPIGMEEDIGLEDEQWALIREASELAKQGQRLKDII